VAADFIPLADYLRPRPARKIASHDDDNVIPLPVRRVAEDRAVERVAAEAVQSLEPTAGCDADASRGEVACAADTIPARELVDVLRDVRVFRARLADGFDEAAARLVRELAAQVLVRELRLAPCEIATLVTRIRERIPVLRVRVSPRDATRMRCASSGTAGTEGVPVLADEQLADGDAIVELAGGALDARLGVRLAAVLEALA
jgi:hypothetical protein